MEENESSDSMDSSYDKEKTPPKKVRKVQIKTFQESWLTQFAWVEKCDDATKARCKICNKVFGGGKSELQKHEQGKKHLKASSAIRFQQSVAGFCKKESEKLLTDKVKNAELKLAVCFAEHNIAVQFIDHLIPLLKEIFDDSKIVQNLNMKRTKCSELLKNVVSVVETNKIIKNLQENNFSIMVDESTDISTKKNLCVLARYLDPCNGKIQTKLIELVQMDARNCTAANLYESFKTCMEAKAIPLKNIIGMASDGCATMVGVHNSFYTHLKEDVPHAVLMSCVCHSAALVATKACEELPRTTEELLRSTYNYVSGSSKRCAQLVEMQEFFNLEKKKLLNLSTTRWLSRHACVTRFLEYYDTLKHYFEVAVFEDKLKSAEVILAELNNLCNKAYLLFLKYSLNSFNSFNAIFQSKNIQIHDLHNKSYTLMKQLCQNFLKLEIVFEKNLAEINVKSPSYFLPLEKIYLSDDCDQILKKLPSETSHNIRLKCLNFYLTAASEIQKRLPFSPIFKEMSFLNVERALTEGTFDFIHLLNHFGSFFDANKIETEWRNLRIYFDKSVTDKYRTYSLDLMWRELDKVKALDDSQAFPNLCKLAKLVLSLPHSNAESERIFSTVTDVKIKKRNKLGAQILNAICVIRSAMQNDGTTCVTFKVEKEHLNLSNMNMYS